MADNIDTNTQDNPPNGRIKERNHTLDWEGIDSERLQAFKSNQEAQRKTSLRKRRMMSDI